ncbi:Ig-like domain-containing protein [Nocardioides sp. SYSU D00038]|uniref:Ig-like domain-containing protein n=1 Tax=Nocardioides sp. SYSU D00038 TaxID=2812554 RepID=UPI0019689FE2|nr:Ig-like domain-containing protein [Nocardioides sp. SYSU D00038]
MPRPTRLVRLAGAPLAGVLLAGALVGAGSTAPARAADDPALPTVSLVPRGEPSEHGWWPVPVTVDVAAFPGAAGALVERLHWQLSNPQDSGVREGRLASFVLDQEGESTLRVRARDASGAAGPEAALTVRVDLRGPTIDVAPQPPLALGAVAAPSYSCADALSGLADCWTDGLRPDGTFDTSRPGVHRVLVFASDRAGHVRMTELDYVVEAPPARPATTRLGAPAVASSRVPVPLDVAVASAGVPVTSGTLTVLDGGRAVGTWPAARRLWVSLPVGAHRLVVVHRSPEHLESRSGVAAVTVKSPTTTTATYRLRRGTRGTVRVKVTGPDARPSGRVRVYDGRRLVGSARLGRDGTVLVRSTRLAAGPHRLTVRYAGSATTLPSASPVRQVRL